MQVETLLATSFDAAVPMLLGVVGVAALVAQRNALRGTTLVGPWWWMLLAIVAVAIAPAAGATGYLAATLTFCPFMAQLGAKRPQDKPWHLIVASLWAVLALPALRHVALGREHAFEVHDAQAWMMLLLLALSVVNALPTRLALSAILFASGQVLLLSSHLPLFRGRLDNWPAAGLVLCVASAVATALLLRRRTPGEPLDALWRDCRDLIGLLWALRLAERFNATATSQDWPIRLQWSGFVSPDGSPVGHELTPETVLVVHRSLANLLRRFVSRDWIALRLGEAID